MNNFSVRQFAMLLKREMLEHTTLFFYAPVILAALIFLFTAWVLHMLPGDELAVAIEYIAVAFDGLSPRDMAPLFMSLSVPFTLVFSICAIVYLLSTLYQDRKDSSVLFWHSMPVSDLRTVLSKLVALIVVAPLFYIAVLFVLYLLGIGWMSLLGFNHDIAVAGLAYLLMAALLSLLLVYCSMVISGLWLFPTVGWLLLFSAFARRAPLMWAVGVFMLLLFLEDFVFGSQFLANWIESRSNPGQYIIFDIADLLPRLFNYDMLFGIAVGSILVGGAVVMRRFTD